MQAEVDTGRDPAAGDAVAVDHDASRYGGRAEKRQQGHGRPMGGCPVASEQAGRAQHERAGAHRRDILRARRLVPQKTENALVLHQRLLARSAGHHHHIQLRASRVGGAGCQHQPAVRADGVQGGGDDMHSGIRKPREDFIRPGEVQLGHVREEQHPNVRGCARGDHRVTRMRMGSRPIDTSSVTARGSHVNNQSRVAP